jgi:hypothetical protein
MANFLIFYLEMLQKPLQLLSLFHMPQARTIHLFIPHSHRFAGQAGQVFIQPVDCFIPGDIPEVFIIRKDVFLVFDGEKFSFGNIINYENLAGYNMEILLAH